MSNNVALSSTGNAGSEEVTKDTGKARGQKSEPHEFQSVTYAQAGATTEAQGELVKPELPKARGTLARGSSQQESG
jgi:hypothetical protein